MTKLWGGRFEDSPAEAMWRLGVSTSFDQVLLGDDCAVLAEHAGRLAAAGLLSDEELQSAARALSEIGALDPGEAVAETDEDIHSTVERLLLERLPEVGPKLRAGLSRNDRVASAFRRALRRSAGERRAQVLRLVGTLSRRAREHAADPIPGYTHLQRAQPVTIGHHLAAHAWALVRDADRIADAAARAAGDPLGAGALAGNTLGLDPGQDPVPNSLDAVAARDHVLELLSAYAICGVHLSRLAEEIVLWTSAEFGFAELADAWATGSSLMPQKKNPDVAELTRGKSGRLIGDLTALLVAVKGLPLAYNRDLQEDKEPFFDADRTLAVVLPAIEGLVGTIVFDRTACRRAAEDPMLFATDLAEALVARGVDFRTAHETVGAAVRRALEADGDEARRAALSSDPALTALLDPETITGCLDVDASIGRRAGNGPATVLGQVDRLDRLSAG